MKTLITFVLFTYNIYASNFTLAASDDYHPIHFNKEVESGSIVKDILDVVLPKSGIKDIEYNAFPWSRAQEQVRLGLNDAMVTTPTAQRLKYSTASKIPVLVQHLKFFININSKNINDLKKIRTLSDIKDISICEYFSSGWAKEDLVKYSKNIIYTKSMIQKVLMLNSQRCDLIIDTDLVINYIIKNYKTKNILELPPIISEFSFHLLISKKSKHQGIIANFDEQMEIFSKSNEYKKIIEKWIN